MLDKINKYVKIGEDGIAGQDARTKEWYCKEVSFKDSVDLDHKISAINKVTNKYNVIEQKKKEKAKKEQKKDGDK